LSVVPPRCGDINIEPLIPSGLDARFVFDYVQCTVEAYDPLYILERGECGQLGPNGNPNALPYTKPSNPPAAGVDWFGRNGGQNNGPGDPGYPGTGGSMFGLCISECECSTTGFPVDGPGCPCKTPNCPGPPPWKTECKACTDTNAISARCIVCTPGFNKKLSSNNTLIRLWCDPTDDACQKGNLTRAPVNVRPLADFAPGSPTTFKWTDHNSFPPTSNLTILTAKDDDDDEGTHTSETYANFYGTVYANTGYTRIATSFKKIDLSEYVGGATYPSGVSNNGGAIVIKVKYPKSHHCYLNPGGGGSECAFQGFKLGLTSATAPRNKGRDQLFGMYKADLSKAKSTTQGGGAAHGAYSGSIGWTTLRLPLTSFSSDWSRFSGECDTKDPDGYQHRCCVPTIPGFPNVEPCPSGKGLGSIIGLSLWAEGVLGDFSIDIKSITIEM